MVVLRAGVETRCSNCEAAEFIGTYLEYPREFRYFFKENLVNSSKYSGSGIRKFPRVPKYYDLRSIVTTFQINNCIAEVKNPNKFSTIAN
jgi:hypothetical protein